MLGWINDCVEKLVIKQFGIDAWHIIKQKAGCEVEDNGFFKMELYPDKSTIDLVVAASEVSGLTIDEVLEAFGVFFFHYICGEGYEDLLCCQGRTIKDWMKNINSIHQHLQTTFPKKMTMPQFWVEEYKGKDGKEDGSLMLYYFSQRGNLLAPVGKGIVLETAKHQFGVDVVMDLTTKQGVDGAKFTT